MTTKFCFIGAGNMGEAIIKGLLTTFSTSDIGILEKNKSRAKYIVNTYKTKQLVDSKKINEYQICILAVKPQIMETVLDGLKGIINDNILIISIAAGITIANIQHYLPNNKIVRVMPNTPALINEGISGISFSKSCTKQDKATTTQIFEQIGKVLIVPEELINSVTALSGSGPAYFYHLADIFAKEASSIGLSYDDSLLLVCQTMLGSAKMMLQANENPSDLITKVKSPGGTTEAALKVLQSHTLSDIIKQTLLAAKNRGDELAK